MEYKDYIMQFFLGVLGIEFKREKNISAPLGGPEWLDQIINYLFSEYANSRDELYQVAMEMTKAKNFDDLKNRLTEMNKINYSGRKGDATLFLTSNK